LFLGWNVNDVPKSKNLQKNITYLMIQAKVYLKAVPRKEERK